MARKQVPSRVPSGREAPKRILGLDPGETTGWTIWENGFFTQMGELRVKPLHLFLLGLQGQFDMFVVEDYKIRPKGKDGFEHYWESVVPAKVIGAAELTASRLSCPVVLSPAYNKPFGYRLIGMTYVKGKKGMHIFDAMSHVAFYLKHTHGIETPHQKPNTGGQSKETKRGGLRHSIASLGISQQISQD